MKGPPIARRLARCVTISLGRLRGWGSVDSLLLSAVLVLGRGEEECGVSVGLARRDLL